MNYLQYIHSVYQPEYLTNDIRYLVSGSDFRVRKVLGQYIVMISSYINLQVDSSHALVL